MKFCIILHRILQLNSLSTCDADKTLTVQCVFVVKNGSDPGSLPQCLPINLQKYISVMFHDYFC